MKRRFNIASGAAIALALASLLAWALPTSAEAKRRKAKRAKSAAVITIAAGTYEVAVPGTTGRSRSVELPAFDIDRSEVTVADYRTCVLSAKCSEPKDGTYFSLAQRRQDFKDFCNWNKADRDSHPVNCLDRTQAAEYCAFRGRQLPTSDQWEAANYAGPGKRTRFAFGDTEPPKPKATATNGAAVIAPAGMLCWERKDRRLGTCPVPSPPKRKRRKRAKKPAIATAVIDVSPTGVFGLTGNVSEWTRTTTCPPAADGSPLKSCLNPLAVIRGGNWYNRFAVTVGATRSRLLSGKGYDHTLGFRCVSK